MNNSLFTTFLKGFSVLYLLATIVGSLFCFLPKDMYSGVPHASEGVRLLVAGIIGFCLMWGIAVIIETLRNIEYNSRKSDAVGSCGYDLPKIDANTRAVSAEFEAWRKNNPGKTIADFRRSN